MVCCCCCKLIYFGYLFARVYVFIYKLTFKSYPTFIYNIYAEYPMIYLKLI